MGQQNSSILDIYQGKMYARNPTAHQVREISESSQAPFGNTYYQLIGSQGFYQTQFLPISRDLDYIVRIWIRRSSADNIPSSFFYVGASFQNHKRECIPFNNLRGYYYLSARQGNTLTSQWEKVQFLIGKNQQVRVPNDAKFMAVCFLVNWGNTTATYQCCGGNFRQM